MPLIGQRISPSFAGCVGLSIAALVVLWGSAPMGISGTGILVFLAVAAAIGYFLPFILVTRWLRKHGALTDVSQSGL